MSRVSFDQVRKGEVRPIPPIGLAPFPFPYSFPFWLILPTLTVLLWTGFTLTLHHIATTPILVTYTLVTWATFKRGQTQRGFTSPDVIHRSYAGYPVNVKMRHVIACVQLSSWNIVLENFVTFKIQYFSAIQCNNWVSMACIALKQRTKLHFAGLWNVGYTESTLPSSNSSRLWVSVRCCCHHAINHEQDSLHNCDGSRLALAAVACFKLPLKSAPVKLPV